jgi:hypothetical protein
VTVFEPMMPEQFESRRPTLEIFHRGLQMFYAGRFDEARQTFAAIASSDPPAAVYEQKCAQLAAEPPQGGWTGVWVMTEK